MKKIHKLLSVFLALLLLITAMSVTAFAEYGGQTTLTVEIPCLVNLRVGDNGKVTVKSTDYTGNDDFMEAAGTVLTYTFTPDMLYKVDKVIYNGADVTGELSGSAYSAPALTGIATLSVSFRYIGGDDFYTVTFIANGHGTAPASQTVMAGDRATEPTAPTEGGWVFGGWYKDDACTETQKYDFDTPVTANLDLYARWTEDINPPVPPVPTYYTVRFNMGGHGVRIAAQTIMGGYRAVRPADPTASGYTFLGWYSDSGFRTVFDFDTAINADTTVYAKWVKKSDPINPRTGDSSRVGLWIALMLITGAIVVLCTAGMGKKKHEKE